METCCGFGTSCWEFACPSLRFSRSKKRISTQQFNTMLYQLVRPYLSMKDFHGQCGCKTEKKTLPISLVGFSKERIHVAMITKALPCYRYYRQCKRIPNRLRNCNRIPFRSFNIYVDVASTTGVLYLVKCLIYIRFPIELRIG